MSIRSGRRVTASHIFPLIAAFGLYIVSSLMIRSNHAQAFVESQKQLPLRLLPDGGSPVQTYYTGFGPLDSYLANLQFIILPVVDGSSPELSLLGWHWFGLLLAVFTAMLVESLRFGRVKDLILFILWGLAIQYCGYFVTMPIYCYVHLRRHLRYATGNSPNAIAASDSTYISSSLQLVPISMFLGYVLPSILMCLPWTQSSQSQQLAVAIWQNFPLWIGSVQLIATRRNPTVASSTTLWLSHHHESAKHIFEITGIVTSMIHIIGILPTILAAFRPDWLGIAFPKALATGNGSSLRPSTFFLPPRWDSDVHIKSMPQGAFNFLRYDYYVGTTAALLWALTLQLATQQHSNHEGRTARGGCSITTRIQSAIMILMITAVLGPGFTIMTLMSQRENVLLENSKKLKAVPLPKAHTRRSD